MEPSACIKEVSSILKKGGYFVVCQINALSFNVLRKPISFLCCLFSSEGFEWAGRNVKNAIGRSANGKKTVLIKRMVKFSNLRRWLLMNNFKLVKEQGLTPSFSTFPSFFHLVNKILNLIPYCYLISHVILATAKKTND